MPFTIPREAKYVRPEFALASLVFSGPRETRVSRRLSPAALSVVIHVLVIAAIVILPLVVGDQVLPATSDAVRAFFVPPPDVALPPPPPPPPPAGARALKPAPAVPQPSTEAKFTAPIDVPDTVRPEESIDFGVEGGVPGGVEGGVPGGVVGGVVGGLPTDVPPPEVKPVRVGGLVQAPKLMHRVEPPYPELARASRAGAVLILEATVGPDGRVRDVKVLRGQPLFDPAERHSRPLHRHRDPQLQHRDQGSLMAAMPLLAAGGLSPAVPLPAAFRHVVCLAALSPEGAVAEAHAAMLARATGSLLTIEHLFDSGAGYRPRPSPGVNAMRSAAIRLARATLEGEAAATGVASSRRAVVVESGPVTAPALAAAVYRLGADVAVMAPHDRGALSQALGFSLTEATVDRLGGTVPVLCARGPALPYQRILVATDFSASSRRALRLAARLSALFGAGVTVLHAVDDRNEADGALAALRRFIPAELQSRSPLLAVEVGEPCAAILARRAALDADLVVLSTRGRDSLRDAVMGTHAQRVIRNAPCPVLVS
jgi:protein TonB